VDWLCSSLQAKPIKAKIAAKEKRVAQKKKEHKEYQSTRSASTIAKARCVAHAHTTLLSPVAPSFTRALPMTSSSLGLRCSWLSSGREVVAMSSRSSPLLCMP
jgi:hypothetical protein